MRLERIIAAVYFFMAFSAALLPALTRDCAWRFAKALAEDSADLSVFALADEFRLSSRLGITYQDVRHKFLIGYDLDPEIKKLIREKPEELEIEIGTLDDGFSLLRLVVSGKSYQKFYYFQGNYLVSPIYYFTRQWPRRESEYLSFIVSDSTFFNSYAAGCLDRFVESTLTSLGAGEEEKNKLRNEKIIYVLARNEEEIKKLIGHRARGMFILAYDYVVSTYSCHYHELTHLLANYILKNPPLETHPFFQEGLAAALGGRGGMEPEVIADLGYFLFQAGMVGIGALLDRNDFIKVDASLSYPASGLYNLFLLQKLGAKEYFQLYRKYSASKDSSCPGSVNMKDLPRDDSWQAFLESYRQFEKVYPGESPHERRLIYDGKKGRIFDAGESYYFELGDTLLFAESSSPPGYASPRFHELKPHGRYTGEKYLIAAGPEEIGIYNLFTNNLAANFVRSFSLTADKIPYLPGRTGFYVRKEVFDQPLEKMILRE
jgi:hypothetical protein